MPFLIRHADLLEAPSDALVYSTNVGLHLSGGVGAQLLERYSWGLQERLHACLEGRRLARRRWHKRGSSRHSSA
jgi:hypothetical protein